MTNLHKPVKILGIFLLSSLFATQAQEQLSRAESEKFRNRQRALAFYVLGLQKQSDPQSRWHKAYRDCAGFIRYTMWEVFESGLDARPDADLLRTHQPLERPRFHLLKNAQQEGVKEINAQGMMRYNARFLGKEIRQLNLKTGDWLFFRTGNQWHAMLLLEQPDNAHQFLVAYHTGEKKGGEIRLLQLEDLFEHPQRQWHPAGTNNAFLGFFRPHFLAD